MEKKDVIQQAGTIGKGKSKDKVVQGLIDRYQLETISFKSIHSDPESFCLWFHKHSSKFSRSTFLSYRKWVVRHLKAEGFESDAELVGKVEWAKEEPKVSKGSLGGIGVGGSNGLGRSGLVGSGIGSDNPLSSKRPDLNGINNEKGRATSELELDDVRRLLVLAGSENKAGTGARYKAGALLSLIFESTCMTGLRPSEWGSASIMESGLSDDGKIYGRVLQVFTSSKGTGDRSVDKKRYLLCDHFKDDEWEKVKATVGAFDAIRKAYESIGVGGTGVSGSDVRTGDGSMGDGVSPYSDVDADSSGDSRSVEDYFFLVIFKPVQNCLRRLCDRLFNGEQRITMYSARHLYAAEFRRGGLWTKYELAAAMGHTDIVNQRYYGDEGESVSERKFRWSLALPHCSHVSDVTIRVQERSAASLENLHRMLRARGSVSRFEPNGDGGFMDFDV